MKLIPLKTYGPYNTRDVITIVTEQASGGRGINLDAMRRRFRIIDALEKTPNDAEALLLEDADSAVLSQLISAFEFNVAKPELLQLIESVVEAKTPSEAAVRP